MSTKRTYPTQIGCKMHASRDINSILCFLLFAIVIVFVVVLLRSSISFLSLQKKKKKKKKVAELRASEKKNPWYRSALLSIQFRDS
jgi:hypothetical protein